MTHNQYEQWIARMYKHGAIDVGQRDDLLYRLNIVREDYQTIRKTMDGYAKYLPTKTLAAWRSAPGG